MKTKRRGIRIQCLTFRVIPDPVVDMWREGKLNDSAVKVWVFMQRLAYEHKGELGFNQIHRYCGVGRTTLSRALKQLMQHGLIQRAGKVYTVVFDPSPKMVPTSPKMVPISTKMVPISPTVVPDLSSESHGELRKHMEKYRETPTPRSTLGPRFSCERHGGASADSSSIYSLSEEDLAALARRYHIPWDTLASLSDSPAVRVAIRALLEGDESKKEFALALLRVLAARGDTEFAGAEPPDPANGQWR